MERGRDFMDILLNILLALAIIALIACVVYLIVAKDDDDEEPGFESIAPFQEQRDTKRDYTIETNPQYSQENTNEPIEHYHVAFVREKSSYPAINTIKIEIIVDGTKLSEIDAGERLVVSLTKGHHTVTFQRVQKRGKTVPFNVGENGATAICVLRSEFSGVFVDTKIDEKFRENNIQESASRPQKTWWNQIPLFVRIAIWIFAIAILLQFIFGFGLGLSIGLS